MSDLWRVAPEASQRFAAQVLDYDRFRPRYPEQVFDDIVTIAGLSAGDEVIEVGAGTGIATAPLADRNLRVTAIEAAPELAALAEVKLAGRGQLVVGRFEDYSAQGSVALVSSFNAWHWIEPTVAVEHVAQLIRPNGYLALIWTEVVSWGQGDFEERLADVFGSPWEKRFDHVHISMEPIREDSRFDDFEVRHHPFARKLDAKTFVAVTKTYGGTRRDEQYLAIERVINKEFQGEVEKMEDAVLYITRRR